MLYYGVDYYPEHWPEERWPEDARLMEDAGMNVVRLAEFAWSRMEPREDQFDFDWLDRAIEILAARGIRVILGTPTASPPPWVMAAHPDAFRVREDGQQLTYGLRREYCPTHAGYRERSASITRAMAEHYQGNPHIIGWQIDNEFGDRCYCSNCQARFQDWLKALFSTLDALNSRWGTVFWSHEYTDWRQVPLPWSIHAQSNPGLHLDYYRFMSDMYVEYQQQQIDIIRAACPDHFITHNLMGFGYDRLNYFELAEPLDFVSWDNYPRGFWVDRQNIDPASLALSHATMRGLKHHNFWVMEAQSGPAGWDVIGATPRPGEIRLWAYQGIAHGADGIVFFRWRTCRFGTEEYWHGVLDHDGQPRRRYEEIKQMGAEIKRIGSTIASSGINPEAALMLSYDSRFAFQIQPNNPEFSYPRHFRDYYAALHRHNIPAGIVDPHADLSAYKLVIVPALYVLDDTIADNLRRFAGRGGVLVITTRSGVKEESNAVVNMPLPGLLADLCGIQIAEYDSLLPDQSRCVAFQPGNVTANGAATVWCDVLDLTSANAAACYTEGYYTGKPAISVHSYGNGKVIYVGTVGDHTLVQTIVDWAIELAGIKLLLETPPNVEVTDRWQDGRRLRFVLNHNDDAQAVVLDGAYQDLVTGELQSGTVELVAKQVMILCIADG